MGWAGLRNRVSREFFEWVVPTVGLMLLGTATVMVWVQVGDDPFFAFLDVLLPALLVALVVWQGMQMQQEELSLEETGIVAGWFGLGMFTLFAFGLWDVFLRLVGQPYIPAGVQLTTQIAAGGLFGLLVGIYGVRARRSAREVTQAQLEQEFLERQHETNELLARILRHHLLNSLAVIQGQTELLADSVDGEAEERVEKVVERAEAMATTIEDIRSITRTLTERPDLTAVDLGATIRKEGRGLQQRQPQATLDVEAPEDVSVRANELLDRAIRNVLSNAVEHSGEEPSVDVRVRTTSEYVHVDVADDGPGIPSAERQRVLEPSERGLESDGEGLGLFLTRSIVEQYGGHIDIADNDPTGTVVTLSVPRADADPDKIPAQ